MTIYTAQSGKTALKLVDEITSVYGSCFRLEEKLWYHVGNTDPFDPATEAEELKNMFIEMVEQLDQQTFDLSKSMAELSEEELYL